jgi:hypothetical protein
MDTVLLVACIATAIVSITLGWFFTRSIFQVREKSLIEQSKRKEVQLLQTQSIHQQLQNDNAQLVSKIAVTETQLNYTKELLIEAKNSGEKNK